MGLAVADRPKSVASASPNVDTPAQQLPPCTAVRLHTPLGFCEPVRYWIDRAPRLERC